MGIKNNMAAVILQYYINMAIFLAILGLAGSILAPDQYQLILGINSNSSQYDLTAILA